MNDSDSGTPAEPDDSVEALILEMYPDGARLVDGRLVDENGEPVFPRVEPRPARPDGYYEPPAEPPVDVKLPEELDGWKAFQEGVEVREELVAAEHARLAGEEDPPVSTLAPDVVAFSERQHELRIRTENLLKGFLGEHTFYNMFMSPHSDESGKKAGLWGKIFREKLLRDAFEAAEDPTFGTPDSEAGSVDEVIARDAASYGPEWYEGILPAAATGAVFGPSGEGKTLAVIARNVNLANGRPWLGVRPSRRAGSLYLPLEDRFSSVLRFRAYAQRHGLALDGVLVDNRQAVSARHAGSVERLLACIRGAQKRLEALGLPLAVVTLDTMNQLVGGSVNNDEETKAVSVLLDRIVREFGVTAEVLGHSPQSDPGRQAGSFEQRGTRDYQLAVNEQQVVRAKHRFAENGRVLGSFEIGSEAVEVEVPGKPLPQVFKMPVWVDLAPLSTPVAKAAAAVVDKEEATLDALEEVISRAPTDKAALDRATREGHIPGWSDAALVRAMKALTTRSAAEGGPVEVLTSSGEIGRLIKILAERGVIEDYSVGWKKGLPRCWRTPGL